MKQVGGVDSQSLVHSDSTEPTHTQDVADQNVSRSYDPYFIAYHEETNTFTFNDPWAQVDQTKSHDTETNFIAEAIVTANELPVAHASAQDPNGCEEVENSTTPVNGTERRASVIYCDIVTTDPQVEIEHVAEVSFPLNTITNR